MLCSQWQYVENSHPRRSHAERQGTDEAVVYNPLQYGRWISRAVQGDLGKGIQHKMAMSELLWPRLLHSLQLASVALNLAVCLAMALGLGGQSMPCGSRLTSAYACACSVYGPL